MCAPQCRKGLAVIHGDANTDLEFFGDNAFDYVVLSQTLQSVEDPRLVLEQLVRIGRKAIVSFENFGYWKTRRSLFLSGRNPIYGEGDRWWNSDVIHPFTIRDFLDLAASLDIAIRNTLVLDGKGRVKTARPIPKGAPTCWRRTRYSCYRGGGNFLSS